MDFPLVLGFPLVVLLELLLAELANEHCSICLLGWSLLFF